MSKKFVGLSLLAVVLVVLVASPVAQASYGCLNYAQFHCVGGSWAEWCWDDYIQRIRGQFNLDGAVYDGPGMCMYFEFE